MSISIIRNIPEYLENYLKGTPSLGMDEITGCSTLYTEYAPKAKNQHGYDDLRELFEDDNKIIVRWLEVHTDDGRFLIKAVPGFDNDEEGWQCRCRFDESVQDYMEDGISPYYYWTITIPDIPKELMNRLIQVTTIELMNEAFTLYGISDWYTADIPVFIKIRIRRR